MNHRCTYEVGCDISSRCLSRCKRTAIQFTRSKRFKSLDETIFDAFCEEHQFRDGRFHEMFLSAPPSFVDETAYAAERQRNPRIYYNSGVDETGQLS